ncbi:MAG: hypothetical protein R2877_03200 [Bdellovibrionota bacterium]
MHFAASSAVAWGAHQAFWMGAGGMQKFDSDVHRRLFPTRSTITGQEREDLILDASDVSYVSFDQCVEQCLAEPEHKISDKFFMLLKANIIKSEDGYQKGDAYNVKDFGYDTVCELYCQSRGHPEFAVPHLRISGH